MHATIQTLRRHGVLGLRVPIDPPLRILRDVLRGFNWLWGLHMRSVICVHERFDEVWPFTADYWHQRWEDEGGCELYRTEEAEARAPDLVTNPETVQRLVLLGLPAEKSDLDPFTGLAECYLSGTYGGGSRGNRVRQSPWRDGPGATRRCAVGTDGRRVGARADDLCAQTDTDDV